jgi:hypothetical protein
LSSISRIFFRKCISGANKKAQRSLEGIPQKVPELKRKLKGDNKSSKYAGLN